MWAPCISAASAHAPGEARVTGDRSAMPGSADRVGRMARSAMQGSATQGFALQNFANQGELMVRSVMHSSAMPGSLMQGSALQCSVDQWELMVHSVKQGSAMQGSAFAPTLTSVVVALPVGAEHCLVARGPRWADA